MHVNLYLQYETMNQQRILLKSLKIIMSQQLHICFYAKYKAVQINDEINFVFRINNQIN